MTLVLPPSPLALAWLCNAWVWSRCLKCQDMFVNLVMEMKARNITQPYVCHLFCVKLDDSATITHGRLQQTFGDHAMSTAQAFRWHKMFSVGWTLVEDEQHSRLPSVKRTGDNTARVRKLVQSDRRLSQNDCWWSEHELGNHSFDTNWRFGDEKYLCQDGAQEPQRATAGSVVERSFWYSNALQWCCSLFIHLISDLTTSFYYKK